jgi:hypothetical protein
VTAPGQTQDAQGQHGGEKLFHVTEAAIFVAPAQEVDARELQNLRNPSEPLQVEDVFPSFGKSGGRDLNP